MPKKNNKNELILLFAKHYKNATGFQYVADFSRDNGFIKEIELSIPVDEALFKKFFTWWNEGWYKAQGILPELKIFKKEINRVVAFKPNQYEGRKL